MLWRKMTRGICSVLQVNLLHILSNSTPPSEISRWDCAPCSKFSIKSMFFTKSLFSKRCFFVCLCGNFFSLKISKQVTEKDYIYDDVGSLGVRKETYEIWVVGNGGSNDWPIIFAGWNSNVEESLILRLCPLALLRTRAHFLIFDETQFPAMHCAALRRMRSISNDWAGPCWSHQRFSAFSCWPFSGLRPLRVCVCVCVCACVCVCVWEG